MTWYRIHTALRGSLEAGLNDAIASLSQETGVPLEPVVKFGSRRGEMARGPMPAVYVPSFEGSADALDLEQELWAFILTTERDPDLRMDKQVLYSDALRIHLERDHNLGGVVQEVQLVGVDWYENGSGDAAMTVCRIQVTAPKDCE